MKKALLAIGIIRSIVLQDLHAQVLPFIPEILTEFPAVRDLALNEKEAYFSIQSLMNEISAIAVIRRDLRGWTAPEIASFSGQYMDLEPFLSPDGLQLFFASNRPINLDSTKSNDFNIWFVERPIIGEPWSEAYPMDTIVNTEYNEFFPSLSASGNIYFTSDRPESIGEDDLFMSVWDGSNYTKVINLGEKINSEGYEFNAYVNPDENILIYTAYNRKDGFGSGDLYYSLKNDENEWGEAINAGPEINSAKMDYCPFYDFETTTLYFTSRRSAITVDYNKSSSINEFLNEINQYENGLSRIYQVSVDSLLWNRD